MKTGYKKVKKKKIGRTAYVQKPDGTAKEPGYKTGKRKYGRMQKRS
jgi:hypothetical protein